MLTDFSCPLRLAYTQFFISLSLKGTREAFVTRPMTYLLELVKMWSYFLHKCRTAGWSFARDSQYLNYWLLGLGPKLRTTL